MFDFHIYLIAGLFITLDIVSGLIKGFALQDINSTSMRKGLIHKSAYVLIMGLAVLCEYGMGYIDLGFSVPVVAPCAVFISLTELVSIMENIFLINPNLQGTTLSNIFNLAGDTGVTTETELALIEANVTDRTDEEDTDE